MTKKEQAAKAKSMAKELAARLKPIQVEMKKKVTELRKVAVQGFKELTQSLFDEHPSIVGFVWEQYTPSYCDGGACDFCVVPRQLYLKGEPKDEAQDICEYTYLYDDEKKDPEKAKLAEAAEAIESLIASVPEEDMRTLFGDNTRVTITAKGVKIEEDADIDDY